MRTHGESRTSAPHHETDARQTPGRPVVPYAFALCLGSRTRVEAPGSPSWARTSDISINSRTLCQLSYGGIRRRSGIPEHAGTPPCGTMGTASSPYHAVISGFRTEPYSRHRCPSWIRTRIFGSRDRRAAITPMGNKAEVRNYRRTAAIVPGPGVEPGSPVAQGHVSAPFRPSPDTNNLIVAGTAPLPADARQRIV